MTPEVVLLLTPFKAPRALPAGVKVFDTTREVSYSHKHLTPLFGVATTPLFLQCSLHTDESTDITVIQQCASLHTDESTDITVTQQCAIMLRYFDNVEGKVRWIFFSS